MKYNTGEKCIRGILLLLMAAIPVTHYICYVNKYSSSVIARVIYGFGAVLLVANLLFMVKNRGKLKFGKYEKIFAVLIICEVISTALSISPRTAVFGLMARNEGILMLFSYYILFYCGRMIQNEKIKGLLIKGFLTVAVIHRVYGLCQYFNIAEDFVLDKYEIYISGLTGNPNFMGTLLVLAYGISLALFLYGEGAEEKILCFTANIIIFVTVLFTKTMSAYLAIFIEFVIFTVYSAAKSRRPGSLPKDKTAFSFLVLTAVVTGVALWVINRDTGNFIFNDLAENFKRLHTMLTGGEISESFGSGRFTIWKNTLTLVPSIWLWGVGADCFAFVYNAEFGFVNGQIIDKCHNEYLQILFTLGLPALACYISVYANVAKDLVSKIKNTSQSRNTALYLGLFVRLIGFWVQAFFNISVIDVAPYFWILLGLAANGLTEN